MQETQARRVVTRHPQGPDAERWRGHLEAPGRPVDARWRGRSIAETIEAMNRDLSPLPDERYEIRESGTDA